MSERNRFKVRRIKQEVILAKLKCISREFSSNVLSNLPRASSVPVRSMERSIERSNVQTTVQQGIEEIDSARSIERSFLLNSPESRSNLAGPSPLQVIEEQAERHRNELPPENILVGPADLPFRHSLTDVELSDRLRAAQERAQTVRAIDEIGRDVGELRARLESTGLDRQGLIEQIRNIQLPSVPASLSGAESLLDWRDNPDFMQVLMDEERLLDLMERADQSVREANTQISQGQVESAAALAELSQNNDQRRTENQIFMQNYEEETQRATERTTRVLRFVNLAIGVVTTAFAVPFLHDLVRVGSTVARETGLINRIATRFSAGNPSSSGGTSGGTHLPTNAPSVVSPPPESTIRNVLANPGVLRGNNTDISDWSAPPQK